MNISKSLILGLLISFVFCRPGSQREACRYNASSKKDYCDFLLNSAFLLSVSNNQVNEGRRDLAVNAALVECLKYFSEIENCKKEENRYIPSIYGLLELPKHERNYFGHWKVFTG